MVKYSVGQFTPLQTKKSKTTMNKLKLHINWTGNHWVPSTSNGSMDSLTEESLVSTKVWATLTRHANQLFWLIIIILIFSIIYLKYN